MYRVHSLQLKAVEAHVSKYRMCTLNTVTPYKTEAKFMNVQFR
jgi:hypothetical protein